MKYARNRRSSSKSLRLHRRALAGDQPVRVERIRLPRDAIEVECDTHFFADPLYARIDLGDAGRPPGIQICLAGNSFGRQSGRLEGCQRCATASLARAARLGKRQLELALADGTTGRRRRRQCRRRARSTARAGCRLICHSSSRRLPTAGQSNASRAASSSDNEIGQAGSIASWLEAFLGVGISPARRRARCC
jgi:hypothetical protein